MDQAMSFRGRSKATTKSSQNHVQSPSNSSKLTVALYLDSKGAVRHFEGLLGLFGEPVDGTLGRANDALAIVGLKKPEALMYEGSRRRLSNLQVGEHHGDHHRRVA